MTRLLHFAARTSLCGFLICSLLDLSNSNCAYAQSLRADPTTGSLVPDMLSAQNSLTRQFSSAQIGNLSSHLQKMHNGYDSCVLEGRVGIVSTAADPARDYASLDPDTPPPRSAAANADTAPLPPADCVNRNLFGSSDSGLWFGGNVNYGENAPGTVEHNYFTSPGMTVGLDHRFDSTLVVGAALGHGWSEQWLDSAGSLASATSTNGTLYLNYKPLQPLSIDALIGYADASVDNHRWVDSDDSWLHGVRHGSSWFGSLSFSSAWSRGGYRVEPYVRSDYVQSSLGSYTEAGNSDLALGYGSLSNNTNVLSAGAIGTHDIVLAGNVLTPLVGVKYQRTLSDSNASAVYYSDESSGASPYSYSAASAPSFVTTRQIGLRYRTRFGLQSEIGASYPFGNNNLYLTPLYTANLRAAF